MNILTLIKVVRNQVATSDTIRQKEPSDANKNKKADGRVEGERESGKDPRSDVEEGVRSRRTRYPAVDEKITMQCAQA